MLQTEPPRITFRRWPTCRGLCVLGLEYSTITGLPCCDWEPNALPCSKTVLTTLSAYWWGSKYRFRYPLMASIREKPGKSATWFFRISANSWAFLGTGRDLSGSAAASWKSGAASPHSPLNGMLRNSTLPVGSPRVWQNWSMIKANCSFTSSNIGISQLVRGDYNIERWTLGCFIGIPMSAKPVWFPVKQKKRFPTKR